MIQVFDYGRFGRGIAVSEQDVDTENPVNIVLQIGGEADEIMGIDLPSISTKSVGIDDVDVSTQTGAGAGILVLFRTNKHLKENLLLLAALLGAGVLFGCLLDLTGLAVLLGL